MVKNTYSKGLKSIPVQEQWLLFSVLHARVGIPRVGCREKGPHIRIQGDRQKANQILRVLTRIEGNPRGIKSNPRQEPRKIIYREKETTCLKIIHTGRVNRKISV